MEGAQEPNWSERVEHLIDAGDTENAIALLESIISKLDVHNYSTSNTSDLELAAALTDLSKLYSSKGLIIRADELYSRASLIKERAQQVHLPFRNFDAKKGNFEDDCLSGSNEASLATNDSSDDWEVLADQPVEDLLSKISLKDTKVKEPARRGRGKFMYKKDESDRDLSSNSSATTNLENGSAYEGSKMNNELQHTRYSTRHVLVLSDLSLSTNTSELERLFEDFKDEQFDIRWVNDTVALAVFPTPSIALEACKHIGPYTARVLEEDDVLMSSISKKDILEPPRRRPKTSTNTAHRLITQGLGIKPSASFGSKELREQEEARKKRIAAKQSLIDEAWGGD